MTEVRREQFEVVVAVAPGQSGGAVEDALSHSGFRFHSTEAGLEGLGLVAKIRPHSIVLVGFDSGVRDWVLNFVEGNEDAPTVIAVAEGDVLTDGGDWLYDVVRPDQVASVLPHRLERALRYRDMERLVGNRNESLGRFKAQIGMLSMVDVTTGLFNRRYFDKHLVESFAAARRYERPLTCLLVRIDNLGGLAEQYGAEPANDILDTIALALSSVIRQADTAARIDEDIFGFLLPETPEGGADRLVQRLLETFEGTEFPHNAVIQVSASHSQVKADHASGAQMLGEAVESLPAAV